MNDGSTALHEGLPDLPDFEFDRFGNPIATSGDVWYVNEPTRSVSGNELDFAIFRYPEVKRSAKLWILRSIKSYAPLATRSQFWFISNAARDCRRIADMNISWFRRLRQRWRRANCEYGLTHVRQWYLWMEEVDFPEVDGEVADEIWEWRIPGTTKGEAVRSHHQLKGPLAHREHANLINVVRNAYSRNETSVALGVVMVCLDLGLNTKQICLIEERDLHVYHDPAVGTSSYMLDVPRIKKRLAKRETKRRAITNETGAVLEAIIARNGKLSCADPRKRPIFCRPQKRQFPEGSRLAGRFDWHLTGDDVATLFRQFCRQYDLRAAGADDKYRIYPRRLRYTFGTRLAAMGTPPAVIAELLDHTDLQHVGVYVEATGLLSDRLDAALAEKLHPHVKRAMRFIDGPAGSVLDGKAETVTHPSKPLGIGRCGSSSLCKLYPPFSCYGCVYFQPWRDADHRSVLEALLKIRAEFRDQQINSSDRLPHQLDEVIENVEAVVAMQKGDAVS